MKGVTCSRSDGKRASVAAVANAENRNASISRPSGKVGLIVLLQ